MAHTTLDLSPRTARRDNDDDNRSATFRRADVPGDAHTDMATTSRRAAYRPPEELARRRDIVEDFRNRLERDATHTPDQTEAIAEALFGIARAEEALGRHDEASEALERLSNVVELSAEHLSVKRRIARGQGEVGQIIETLDEARQVGDPRQSALVALERAHFRWEQGASDAEIVGLVDAIDGLQGDLSVAWQTRLGVDALLEQHHTDQAIQRATDGAAKIQDPALRRTLEARAAVWQAVWGDISGAADRLERLRRRAGLPGDLGRLLASLFFDLDDRQAARQVLVGLAGKERLEASQAVTCAMLQESVGKDSMGANRLLSELGEREPQDWTALRRWETHLERYVDRTERIEGVGGSLIDVFNLQLEGPLSNQERVAKLTRLGRLYECEADLEEAAAEVYREALLLEPDHVPALRALGRLYSRRDNWAGLADLYEREIANMAGAPSVWRRHFQLAEIYRVRLENGVRALEHYRKVLDHRPHYLPALKAAAGLLSALGRYRELADLFLASVEVAPNRRQKLYLLDKVAEVAERELQNYDVAIGAWQEILMLDEQHPRAFAALGRLYAQTGRFGELLELNLHEIEFVEDAEEEAVLRQKCAEIAERHLEDLDLAEEHYRAALSVLPDFLPALEGLGRLYMRKERWDDIIEMSGRELQQTDDLREAVRRLGALAEIFESQLDRREDAILLYDRILEIDPRNAHALESALRLNYTLERWTSVIELLERKLVDTTQPRSYAALQGEIGHVCEWHLDAGESAFGRYLAALDAEPDNSHWLEGVARTWTRSNLAAGEVADRLEDNVVKPMDGDVRDGYFRVIARLRERQHNSADASRAYRMHGAPDSFENQIVLQLAMTRGGERGVLRQFRRAYAHHPIERLIDINRTELTRTDVEALRAAIDALEPAERGAVLSEIDVRVAAEFVGPEDADSIVLSADLVGVLEGNGLFGNFEAASTDPLALRLRAVEARQAADFAAYLFWTRRELELRDSRDLKVSRLVEVAEYAAENVQSESRDDFLEEAALTAFPEMGSDPDESEEARHAAARGAEDGPTLDRLYQAIRGAQKWELLRACLEAHSTRTGLSSSRRLYLFRTLAEVLDDQLEDFEAASKALSHCWQLSEDPDYLRELVRVSRRRDELGRAIRFQQRHFEHVTEAESSPEACVQSGLWLAELLLDDERLEDGIDCLEHLLATYETDDEQSIELIDSVRRQLAYAYMERQNAYRAVELFQSVLGDEVDEGELDEWRALITVYSTQLDDRQTAYELQWKVVECDHGTEGDLERLVDLAFDADRLEACAERLEAFAEHVDRARRLRLLGRAAQIVEEDLMLPEEAARLYTEALELCDEDHEQWRELVRRRAFCLSQIVGREHRALQEFRKLVAVEPFEPTTYRGLSDLMNRAHAYDRARAAEQVLGLLNCSVDIEAPRTKTEPSRCIEQDKIAEYLLPEELDTDTLEVLRAAMPLVEKAFRDELPQRKALEGQRLHKLDATEAHDTLAAALEAFGISRFKAESGDAGPTSPQVFSGSSPYVWLNCEQVEQMDTEALRFIAGYCAAIAWSGLSALLTVDGRRVWHVIEAVQLKQTGCGFDERVDVATQDLVDAVSSPFDAVARRRLAAAIEPIADDFAQAHCERWPRAVEQLACRVGLVMCGDVRAAVRGLLSFHGWKLDLDDPETQTQIRRNPEVRSLIDFAISDDYLQARYALGLAGKPSRLVK